MTPPHKPTPILMTLTLADCVRAGSVEKAIEAHPVVSVELAFLWQSESHKPRHNDETSRVIRDWGRMRLRQWPVLDLDTGKTAETADFEWDSLHERGEFSAWSPRSAVAFALPTLAECLADYLIADEIFGRAMHCPWDGIDEAAWDALQAAFEAELAKPIDY